MTITIPQDFIKGGGDTWNYMHRNDDTGQVSWNNVNDFMVYRYVVELRDLTRKKLFSGSTMPYFEWTTALHYCYLAEREWEQELTEKYNNCKTVPDYNKYCREKYPYMKHRLVFNHNV